LGDEDELGEPCLDVAVEQTADRIMTERLGSEVDYAVNLWWRRY